jgi:hypothetical protein
LISIENEVILVGSRSGNTFNSLTRAQCGSATSAHTNGKTVELVTDCNTTPTSAAATRAWTVTSDVVAFRGGTSNYGWRITDAIDDNANAETSLNSKEATTAANRPTLVIQYT